MLKAKIRLFINIKNSLTENDGRVKSLFNWKSPIEDGLFLAAGKSQEPAGENNCIVIVIITLLFLGIPASGVYFCRYHTAVLPFVISFPARSRFDYLFLSPVSMEKRRSILRIVSFVLSDFAINQV